MGCGANSLVSNPGSTPTGCAILDSFLMYNVDTVTPPM